MAVYPFPHWSYPVPKQGGHLANLSGNDGVRGFHQAAYLFYLTFKTDKFSNLVNTF